MKGEKSMRKTPYTTELFYRTISEKVLNENPDIKGIIDYSLPAQNGRLMKSIEISPVITIDYGGSEGIYLNFSLKFEDDTIVHIGTVKTLLESDDAMYLMGKLNAALVIETYRFLNNNNIDFTWHGYRISECDSKGNEIAPSVAYFISRKEDVSNAISKYFIKKGIELKNVMVTDLSVRKKFHINQEDNGFVFGDIFAGEEEN